MVGFTLKRIVIYDKPNFNEVFKCNRIVQFSEKELNEKAS
jgi:hypothetical protein